MKTEAQKTEARNRRMNQAVAFVFAEVARGASFSGAVHRGRVLYRVDADALAREVNRREFGV